MYLVASSLSDLLAVKRGCTVVGLALNVVGSPVKGLMPFRALVFLRDGLTADSTGRPRRCIAYSVS